LYRSVRKIAIIDEAVITHKSATGRVQARLRREAPKVLTSVSQRGQTADY
jgi:hypothetical protein